MENKKKKSGGVEIPKKNRSLDLKSLYEPRLSEVGKSKKKVSDENDPEKINNKKRRSRKEVPLSHFEPDAKKSRKEDAPELGLRQRSNRGSKDSHGISLALCDNGSSFNIPKRPRGLVGRRKLGSDQGSNHLRHPNSVDREKALKTEAINSDNPNDRLVRLVEPLADDGGVSNSKPAAKVNGSLSKLKHKANSKSIENSSSSTVKSEQKVEVDKVKEKGNGPKCDHVVNNIDMSPKKRRSNSRKKKNLAVGRDGGEVPIKKSEPSVGSSVSNSPYTDLIDEEDDDEENLEQNAARMLSSRFDPSCTGFMSKRKSSASQMADGLSFPSKSLCGEDDKSRSLRPRKEDKGKGVSRKRRHFYDILVRDLDPHWFLNRRIKIFWPLDESWYYGLVNDYHSESELHHIEYDDRDEEWLNLQGEKFKLLLLPNEVPNKEKPRKPPTGGDKDLRGEQIVPPADDDSCTGDYLDSEPIASWLASQSQRVKSSSKSLKRKWSSEKHPPLVSSLLSDRTANSKGDVDDSKLPRNKPVCESASKENIRAVYVRKKYQKKVEGGLSVTPLTPVAVGLPTTKDGKYSHGFVDSNKELWSFNRGDLRLNDVLLESKELCFKICLPELPFLEFSCGIWVSWLLHEIFMLQHGVVVTASPAVTLEMLFVDSNSGMRFLLLEGCMNQALAFVFLILNVFSQSDECWTGDVKLPVTSIRFKLSSVQDLRKQHVFSFYSFSRLQSSKWLFLDSKILQHCLVIKNLPVTECTYDNIRELEHGSFQRCKPCVGLKLSSNEGSGKIFLPGILPMGVSREARNRMMNQSASSLAAKLGKVPQFTLSFSAAPSFFLTLHLQLLMEISVNLQHQDSLCSAKSSENGGEPVAERSEHALNSIADVTVEHALEVDDVSVSNVAESTDSKVIAQPHQCENNKEVKEQIVVSASTYLPPSTTSPPPYIKRGFTSVAMTVDIPPSEQGDMPFAANGSISGRTPTGGKPNFMPNGFSNGPKKPRTHVQYTLPFVDYDPSAKRKMPSSSSRSLPCKRIRRASLKRTSDGSDNNQKNMESVTSVANVLVTDGDKGWRECGAHVFLEAADQNEWRLAVKLSGVVKYSYKVKHIMQPGSTNRYSHAMMWKGGKDWVLEFPDRSQWMVFKEMHEECYNRNIRAASVKNIPIPGVRLVEESDDCGTEVPFVRNSKYFRQLQSDIEMAMDPRHILYDMDSDDELWLEENQNFSDKQKSEDISDEFFEKAIDMFEKISYSQRREEFTDAEIEDIVIGIGPVGAAKVIYEHWRQKRNKLGMPLIRHLQPPLWERYQRQLKEWERDVARRNSAFSAGSQEKVPPPEKPPVFAFCFRPRGLDVPNKGSKQRSHRKLSVSGHHHTSPRDHQDSLLVFGRRSNGHAFDIHDSSDISPAIRASRMVLSPRDAHFSLSSSVSEWKGKPKVYKHKSKKLGSYSSFRKQQVMMSSYKRTTENRNGVQQWNMGMPELTGQRDYYSERPRRPVVEKRQLDGSDLYEFQLRDASGAAHRAVKMAKVKREKAQRLLYRADLAMHKALAALMTAEAIKDSSENLIAAKLE